MVKILFLLALSLMTQSCIFEYPDCEDIDSAWRKVDVRFDMSSCPDADPEGMAVFLYPDDGAVPWRFDLIGLKGGVIEVPFGQYSVIAYNNDTSGLIFNNTDRLTGADVTTRLTDIFSGMTTLMRQAIPGGPPEGTEKVVLAPQMLWSGIIESLSVSENADTIQTVTIPIHRNVANINVEISNVSNLGDISRMSAALTGMAGSFKLYAATPSGELSAIPFSVKKTDGNTIKGNLTSFGKIPDSTIESWLILYVWLKDGKRFYYKFNVTSQIINSTDPLDINIRIKGITIPEAEESGGGDSGGGFDVGVDGWDYVIIDL